MSAESHVIELRKKHQALSDMIEAEERAPGADQLAISHMKREKLRLKEAIERHTIH